jgi:hypothetical protein
LSLTNLYVGKAIAVVYVEKFYTYIVIQLYFFRYNVPPKVENKMLWHHFIIATYVIAIASFAMPTYVAGQPDFANFRFGDDYSLWTTFFQQNYSSDPLCLSPQPSIFSDYSFWVHHPVTRDDRQLLAHAMASDFSVT